MIATVTLEIRRDDSQLRYLAEEDGHRIGLIDYRIGEDKITILHTETLPAVRGRGIADQLTRFAVDDIRSLGFKIIPECPFTKAWFDAHPDDSDLLAVV